MLESIKIKIRTNNSTNVIISSQGYFDEYSLSHDSRLPYLSENPIILNLLGKNSNVTEEIKKIMNSLREFYINISLHGHGYYISYTKEDLNSQILHLISHLSFLEMKELIEFEFSLNFELPLNLDLIKERNCVLFENDSTELKGEILAKETLKYEDYNCININLSTLFNKIK
jgi:hypothetical protein